MDAKDIFGNKVVQAASVSVVSFAAGGVLGYFLGKRSKETPEELGGTIEAFTYQTIDEEDEPVTYEVTEIAEGFDEEDEQAPTISIPSSDTEDEDVSEPSKGRNIEWMGPDPRDQPPPEQEYVDVSNVFDDTGDGEWDEEAELAKRSDDEPYIISVAEFLENETGFTQTALTFYTGDQMMVDEENKPVYNYRDVLGDNLRFGHGSNSDDIVYIRNVKRRGEFEVIEFEGHYAQEQLGLEAEEDLENELRHAEPRRFRMKE